MTILSGHQDSPKEMKKHKKLAQVFISLVLVMLLLPVQAFALEVPVSQTEQMIDGKQTLVKVFEVSPETAPESLIEEGLEQNGYRYYMTSIVKDAVMVNDEKEITQEEVITVSVANENSARLEALKSFPPFIEYEQDGYSGKLYPVISSIEGEITGRTNHSGKKTITRTYTKEYNDDSLIPTTDSGYSLSNISWAEGNYVSDSAIPESYIATATYTKPYSYSTVNGWNFKMTYTGDVEYEHEDVIRYTLTYTGEKIGFFSRLFGNHSPGATAGSSSWIATALGIIFLLAAVVATGLGLFILYNFLKNNRVSILVRDDISGEYQPLKDIWYRRKTAMIEIDTLAAPSAQYFRIIFRPALAEELKGKVITITAGQYVTKHQIGDSGGAEYVIDINLESN